MLVAGSSINTDLLKGYPTPSPAAKNKGSSTTSSDSQAIKSQDSEHQQQIQALKSRDQEVRSHELAHLSAAGGIAVSGPHFQYTTGPDGVRYATGGEVNIDTSSVSGDPAATILKAESIRRAALAPANPSGQDQSVAAKAEAMANKARMELLNVQQGAKQTGSQLNIRV